MMFKESEEALQNYNKLLSLVRNRIKKKKDLNEPIKGNRFARNPLTEAATADFYLPITHMLLEHNANPNKADSCGNFPLVNAVSHNSIENIKILLRKNANPNPECKPHSPPLLLLLCRMACSAHEKQCLNAVTKIKAATVLLQAGADPNAHQEGQTCIQTLINCPLNIHPEIHLTERKEKKLLAHRKELIKLLIDHGANLLITDPTNFQTRNDNNFIDLTHYAFNYYHRLKLIRLLCYPNCPGRNVSPFMKLPKELVKMIVFMMYPSHKNREIKKVG